MDFVIIKILYNNSTKFVIFTWLYSMMISKLITNKIQETTNKLVYCIVCLASPILRNDDKQRK